jgi:hypothetical protein
MAEAVTIDNYNVKIHQRWATDQESYDASFVKDANAIPPHLEVAAREISIASKFDELFETHHHRHPFASFSPPPRYQLMRNRFFSIAIAPEFDWAQDADEEDEEEQRKQERRQAEAYKKKIAAKQTRSSPLALFEKDKLALLNLIDEIQSLNGFLREVYARKLQYQKG